MAGRRGPSRAIRPSDHRRPEHRSAEVRGCGCVRRFGNLACQRLPGRNSGMTELSVDYTRLAGNLTARPVAACVGAALLAAVAERYESQYPHCSLVEFVQSG